MWHGVWQKCNKKFQQGSFYHSFCTLHVFIALCHNMPCNEKSNPCRSFILLIVQLDLKMNEKGKLFTPSHPTILSCAAAAGNSANTKSNSQQNQMSRVSRVEEP